RAGDRDPAHPAAGVLRAPGHEDPGACGDRHACHQHVVQLRVDRVAIRVVGAPGIETPALAAGHRAPAGAARRAGVRQFDLELDQLPAALALPQARRRVPAPARLVAALDANGLCLRGDGGGAGRGVVVVAVAAVGRGAHTRARLSPGGAGMRGRRDLPGCVVAGGIPREGHACRVGFAQRHRYTARMIKVFRDAAGPCLAPAGSVVAVGAFDGLHRGHAALLARVRERAMARALVPSVVSFEPLPRAYFAHGALSRLASVREKLLGFRDAGIELALLLRFNAALAATDAADFVREVLAGRMNAREVWVGEDFRFGHRRAGDVALLRRMGAQLGFDVHTPETVEASGERVSATRIR